jgi:nicotinate-nucleotide pyrophosphorylase (carboxylating)
MEFPGIGLRAEIDRFLAEDLGRGDATTEAVIEPDARAIGHFLAKSEMVVCGLSLARSVLRRLDPDLAWVEHTADGETAGPGQRLAGVAGRARALLSGERVALNLAQRLSGIATVTRKYVEAVAGTNCRILDTRKTAPGLRMFDKMAVVTGGGRNHRFGLDDGVLIKDNHIRLCRGVGPAVERARRRAPGLLRIEVEVESELQLKEALAAGADLLLLDNRAPEEVAKMAALAREARPGVTIEASGGITLENVRAYAEAGADFVSVGALTHSVVAADISLELEIA